MVKICILYPNNKGSRFDMDYYIEQHMPQSIRLLSAHPGFKSVSVEKGLQGAAPESQATYVAMCHFVFESTEAFLEAFIPHSLMLQDDMANYTDITPVIQVNEILISK